MSAVEGREELEEQREFLLRSLLDLETEREAGEIAEDDYERLKQDYTARAAAVLRALKQEEGGDEDSVAEVPAAGRDGEGSVAEVPADDLGDEPEDAPAGARRRRRRRVASTISVVLVVALIAAAGLALFSGDSEDPLLAGTPAERLARAHQLAASGEALNALKLYDSVITEQPNNAEAFTYRGWLLARANLSDRALESLDRAIAIAPGYPDPHFFRGMVLYRFRNDPAAAVPEFEAFLANNPPAEAVQEVQGVLERARQESASTATTTTVAAPAPG